MIDFNQAGIAIVRFEVESISHDKGRRVIEMSLVDYLALVKSSNTLSELRCKIIEWGYKDKVIARGAGK